MLFLLRRTPVKTLKHLPKFLPIDDDFKNTELISDDEHEKNVNTIRNINRNIDIKVCAGGNINRLEDIKKLLFAGCLQVILNASKPSSIGLAEEASARFGKDRILLSINNVDFIFKNQE